MKRFSVVLALVAALSGAAAYAQAPAPAPLDAAARSEVVKQAATSLRSRYVFPEVGNKAADKIEAQLAVGAYDSLADPRTFAVRLTEDLAEVAHDKHLRVAYAGGPPPGASGGPAPTPLRSEAGVVRADRLAGNIGYIEISGFPPPEVFKPAVDRAMASLKGVTSLVIDDRRNGGGSPDSVAYLVSYFVDSAKQVLLNEFTSRKPGTTEFSTRSSFTSPTPISFKGTPVYLLTSARTFSGGEEFAYDMQAFKLATLVGETTGGGANPGGAGPIGRNFSLFVPTGRPINAVTKTNWEGVGVVPDLATPVGEALKVALNKLGQPTTAANIDDLTQARLFQPRGTANPGSEAVVRQTVIDLAAGAPHYDDMTPGMAATTRAQLPQLKDTISKLGALKSVVFKEVDPQGGDAFEVTFEGGAIRFTVVLNAEGKLASAGFRPI